MKPYKKAQMIPLEGLKDRRRRLTDKDKEDIREMYAKGGHSLNNLARMYHVSKSLILITVNPRCAKRVKERIRAHWKEYASKPGARKKLTDAVRSWRRYKYKLFKETQEKENHAR